MLIPTTFTLAAALVTAPSSSAEPSTDSQPSPETPTEAETPPRRRDRIGGFVAVDWRVLGMAGHLSHGPGFQAGATFFDHLAIGLAGFARPGPINPRTFRLDLPDGQTYRGQGSIDLRSDGSVIGLLIAPYHDFRRVPLSLELPVTLGYGGFGFYLSGEDREVPDDRRVSEWEDELLDGRDADATNLVVDAGVRLAWTPRRAPYLRPYFGAHYTWVIGYDTAITNNYDGFSGVVGIKFGKFTRRR
ncbi:MAG: hypothetical protein AAF799_23520 [Myxococcota bacterium]